MAPGMAITYEPRLALPQWSAGADPFTRAQMDDAFAKLGRYGARAEQGPTAQLPAPAAPTLTTANVGGTLVPATYGYRISALSAASGTFPAGETLAGVEATIVVPAGTNTNVVNVTWPAVAGSNGYRVYGRTPAGEHLLTTVAPGVTNWQDTGANPPGANLPAANTTPGQPAPGIMGRFYWSTDDRGGRLRYDDGAALWDLGPGPVTGPQAGSTALIVAAASAATSDDVLRVRGKTGQTGPLARFTDPTGATDLVRVDSTGALSALAGLTVRPASTGAVGATINGLSGQTGDLQQWQNNGTLVGRIGPFGALTVQPSSTAVVGATVNIPSGSSSDIQQWQLAGATKANLTSTGRLAVTGGVDVAGSPNGYGGGELRFTGSALAPSIGTDATNMLFDHRAASNTGGWAWRNGTNGATNRMVLSGAGELAVNGSPNGGSYRLSVFGATGTNSPVFVWTHGSATGDGAYALNLSSGADAVGGWLIGHAPTNNGALKFAWEAGSGPVDKVTIDTAGRLAVTGGADVDGSPSGTDGGELRFTNAGASKTSMISTLATGSPITSFQHRAASNTGSWSWANGTSGATAQMTLGGTGNLAVIGTDHYLGAGALGGTGGRLHVNIASASTINIKAEDQTGTLQTLQLYTGALKVQDPNGWEVFRAEQRSLIPNLSTNLLFYYVDAAVYTFARAKVGAAGTGPGGSGRALYV